MALSEGSASVPACIAAIIAVFDELTGAPCAVMGATYITAIRTAMTSALVARALARPQSASLAIIGAGVQADAHLRALSQLMGLNDVRVAARQTSGAAQLAKRHAGAGRPGLLLYRRLRTRAG